MRNTYYRFFSLIIVLFFLSSSYGDLKSQEYEPVPLSVSQETFGWHDRSVKDPKQKDITFLKNTTVFGDTGPLLNFDIRKTFFSNVIFNNNGYSISTYSLLPKKTMALLPESWITNIDDKERQPWVITYHLDVFSSQKRETYLKYEKKWIELLEKVNKQWYESESSTEMHWWDVGDLTPDESLLIFQSSISLGSLGLVNFWIKNITPYRSGYRLTVQGDKHFFEFERDENECLTYNLPFPHYRDRKTFDLILIPDGDYMDVYLDSMKTKLASFAKVDKNFLTQYERLISYNKCALSWITFWPRRADGSMDYPPPKGAYVNGEENPGKTHFTFTSTADLNLRTSAKIDAPMKILVTKGARLFYLSFGKDETIDGISSTWVEVETESGEYGWCFGGYLDPKP